GCFVVSSANAVAGRHQEPVPRGPGGTDQRPRSHRGRGSLPQAPAIVREGGARVLVAQLASEDESLRRTAARVVRGLSRSPHTTP
ncbi:unnamed protein product, partial [Ectocarpus sp. 4 AP-2014]